MVVTGVEDVVMGVVVEVFIEVEVLIPVIAAGVDIANVSCVEETVVPQPTNADTIPVNNIILTIVSVKCFI